MKCTSCNIKPICTIYSTVLEHSSEIGIQISFCNYYSSPQSKPVKETTMVGSCSPRRTPEQILETSDQIRKIYESDNEKKDAKENEDIKCSVCEAKKEQRHIHYTCSSCGKESICENCATEDITDSKMYCPGCWSKME